MNDWQDKNGHFTFDQILIANTATWTYNGDVYEAMAQGLHEENAKEGEDPVPGFGKFSASYVGNVYAFAFLLQNDLDKGVLTSYATKSGGKP